MMRMRKRIKEATALRRKTVPAKAPPAKKSRPARARRPGALRRGAESPVRKGGKTSSAVPGNQDVRLAEAEGGICDSAAQVSPVTSGPALLANRDAQSPATEVGGHQISTVPDRRRQRGIWSRSSTRTQPDAAPSDATGNNTLTLEGLRAVAGIVSCIRERIADGTAGDLSRLGTAGDTEAPRASQPSDRRVAGTPRRENMEKQS
jgi:hypothetical protein